MRKILSLMISVLFAGSLIADTYYSKALNEIASTDVVLITAQNADGEVYALSNDQGTSAAPKAVAVTLSAGAVSAEASNIQWNVKAVKDENEDIYYVFYPNGETEKWLYCTNTNNGVRVGDSETNAFSIEATSGYLFSNSTSRYLGVYNKQDWRCYTSVNNNIKNQTLAFYVLDASSVSKDVYTVAGAPAALFGTTWDPTLTSNDMQKNAAGLYVWSKEQVTLGAGDVSFKVVTNHDWANASYPSDNYSLKVEKDGTYDCTIWFDPSSKAITPVLVGDTISCSTAILLAEMGYTKEVVIKGYVTELIGSWNSEYSNVSFWMADESNGGQQFEAYRVACASADDAPAIGDLVWVKAPVKMYGKTPETNGGNFGILYSAPEATYTVAGSSVALFGSEWKPEDTNNDMAKDATGLYVWSKENVELAAGEILFKVAKDHSWNVAYPASNYSLAIADAAKYNITITFNPSNEEVSAKAEEQIVVEDTITCAKAVKLAGQGYAEEVVIKGYVTQAGEWSEQFSNVTFWMADAADGGQVFEGYRVSCASAEAAPAEGDLIWVKGTITLYGGRTPETNAGATFGILKAATPVVPEEPMTVYLINMENWWNANAYVWYGEGNDAVAKAPWPGEIMTLLEEKFEGKQIYSFSFPKEYVNIIFTGEGRSGSGLVQTIDLTWSADKPYYLMDAEDDNGKFHGKWYASLNDIPTGDDPEPKTTTFIVNVPEGTENVYIAGSHNGWTFDKMEAAPTALNQFQITYNADYSDAAYKFSAGPDWAYVEVTSDGKDANNRTYLAGAVDEVPRWKAVPSGEQPAEDVYTVAGAPAAVFGAEWDPTLKDNDMEKADDFVYMWIKENLTLEKGSSISLKVVKNHAWDESWPAANDGSMGNVVVEVNETAIYSLAVEFNSVKKSVDAWLTKTGDVEQPQVSEWAEIVFTNEAEKGTLDGATFAAPANENFKLTVTDTDSKIAIDANIANFGTFDSYFEYNYRLKTGGKSSAKNALTLAIPADGLLRVAVRTGNNDATDRTLVIKQDGEELYNRVVQESDASALTEYNTAGEPVSKNIYPYRDVNVKAGTVNIEYPIGGLNFYSFGFKKVEQPVQKTTTFIVNVPEGTENVYIAGSHNGWTFDKMEAAPVSLNQFQITYDADYSDASYKYSAGPDWAYVEVTENGSDANNRTFLEGAVDEVPRWKAVPGEQPAEDVYTVVGGMSLTGENWNPAAEANDMKRDAAGLYTWEKTKVILAEDTKLKVAKNHSWDESYPQGDDHILKIAAVAEYTVTVTFNPETKEITATAVKTGDATLPNPVVSIAGEMNSWNATADVMTPAEDALTASVSMKISAGTYSFKVVFDAEKWMTGAGVDGKPYQFDRDNVSAGPMNISTGERNDLQLVADVAGDYIFTWKFADSTLVVTFPEKQVVEDVYSVVGAPAEIFGEEWNTEVEANIMTEVEKGLYTWGKESIVLRKGATIQMKVVKNHSWNEAWPAAADGKDNNYVVNVEEDGIYTFFVQFDTTNDVPSISASLTKTGDAPVEEAVTLYFVNTLDWTTIKAYVWYDDEAGAPHALYPWAGDEMIDTQNPFEQKAVYSITFPKQYVKLIFNNGQQIQTDDLTWDAAKPIFVPTEVVENVLTGVWYSSFDAIPSGGEQPVEDVYTVVGNSVTLFGTTWDPTLANNDMKYEEEYKGYVWYREEVELEAGNIEFKVVKNHAWENGSWPENNEAGSVNYILTIEKAGKYDVGILFNAETKGIQASAELVEEPIVAEWDEIRFYEALAAGNLNGATMTGTNERFVLSVTDDGKMAIDKNTANFGDFNSYFEYNYRLKTGGKSSANRALTINVPADGLLRIAVRTGNNNATDRNLVIKQGEEELYNRVVQESDASALTEYNTAGEQVTKNIYPYIDVNVKAGAVNIEFPTNGLNFYGFGFKKVEQPVQKTTTFIVNVPEGTENVYIAGSHNGWTFDKMEAAPTALNQFQITYDADYSDASYKYCAGPDWAYVEVTSDGKDANNRTYLAGAIDEVPRWKAVPGEIIDNGPIIDTYFASGDTWTPDNESSATWDSESEKVTVNIVQAKQAQWQAQVKYQGPEAKVGKLYDLSFKMKANKTFRNITIKWQNNAPMVDQQIDLEEGVEYSFAKKDMDGILGDGILVFDFGFAPAGTVVEIYDVVFAEKEMPVEDVTVYFVNDEAWETVKAYIWDAEGTSYKAWGESDAMTKTTAQVAGMDVYTYTYSSVYLNIIFHNGADKQTINLMRDREKPYCYREQWFASLNEIQALVDKGPFETWFTGPDNWDGESQSNLVYDATTGKATVNILVDKNAQWKAQVKYQGKKAQEGMLYDLSLKMKANKAVSGITLKYQNNAQMLYENQTLALEANVELAYAKSNLEGLTGDGIMVLDFGYATAGTVIEIYDIAIIEKEKAFIPAESYSLAGDLEALFGTAWNPESTANDMVRDQSAEGFIYKYQKTGVEIYAKQIAFKIVENHSWAIAYPSDDYILPIREEGIYTIDVIFNAETQVIEATATKTGNVEPYVPTIPNGYYLVGNMTNWQVVADAKYLFSAAPEAGVYNLVYTLKDGDMFKVVEMYNDAATWLPGSVSGDDRNFNVTAAYAGEKNILFRPDGEGGEDWYAGYIFVEKNNEAPMPKFYIAGSFTNWAEGMIPVYEDSYEIAFDKADTYFMKVVTVDEAGQHWYGHSDLAEKDKFLGDPEGNIWLQVSISSFVPNPKVQVAFDAETKKITVTGNCMKLQKPVTDGYYLFSAMTAVYVLAGQIPENFKFVENEAVPGEYSATAILLEGDSFVAVLIQGNQILQYYPGETSVSVDGIHAGAEKTVYFRTVANDAWKSFHESGLFWVDENPAPEEPVVRLYVLVDVQIKWKKIYAYAWKNVIENEIQKQIPYKAWPGIEMDLFAPTAGSNAPARVMMKQVDETSYVFDCPKSYDNIIFTDGTEQTADQVWKEDKPVFILSAEKDGEGKNKGEWKQDSATGIENIELDSNIEKLMLNGEIYILKNGKIYNVTGQLVR